MKDLRNDVELEMLLQIQKDSLNKGVSGDHRYRGNNKNQENEKDVVNNIKISDKPYPQAIYHDYIESQSQK